MRAPHPQPALFLVWALPLVVLGVAASLASTNTTSPSTADHRTIADEEAPAGVAAEGRAGDVPRSPGEDLRDTVLHSVQRLPDGRTVVAVSYSLDEAAVYELDAAGRVIWQHRDGLAWTHSAQWLPGADADDPADDRFLLADTGNNRVIEIDRTGAIVWTYAPPGLDYPNDADRLPNGHTLVTVRDGNLVVEVDPAGDPVWYRHNLVGPHNADRLANGHTIVAHSERNRVVELAADGREVWRSREPLLWPRDADRLANGRTLVADSGNARVIELDADGRLVRAFSNAPMVYDADRLPNGHTLFTRNGPGADPGDTRPAIVELDPHGAIVWQWTAPTGPANLHGFQRLAFDTPTTLRRDMLSLVATAREAGVEMARLAPALAAIETGGGTDLRGLRAARDALRVIVAGVRGYAWPPAVGHAADGPPSEPATDATALDPIVVRLVVEVIWPEVGTDERWVARGPAENLDESGRERLARLWQRTAPAAALLAPWDDESIRWQRTFGMVVPPREELAVAELGQGADLRERLMRLAIMAGPSRAGFQVTPGEGRWRLAVDASLQEVLGEVVGPEVVGQVTRDGAVGVYTPGRFRGASWLRFRSPGAAAHPFLVEETGPRVEGMRPSWVRTERPYVVDVATRPGGEGASWLDAASVREHGWVPRQASQPAIVGRPGRTYAQIGVVVSPESLATAGNGGLRIVAPRVMMGDLPEGVSVRARLHVDLGRWAETHMVVAEAGDEDEGGAARDADHDAWAPRRIVRR